MKMEWNELRIPHRAVPISSCETCMKLLPLAKRVIASTFLCYDFVLEDLNVQSCYLFGTLLIAVLERMKAIGWM